jgi:hypothetical protein
MSYEEYGKEGEEQARSICHDSILSVRVSVRTGQLLRAALHAKGNADGIQVSHRAKLHAKRGPARAAE